MAWIDQKEVARQHLGLATDAIERARADAAVSPDVLAAVEELRSATIALAKIAGVGFDEGETRTR